MKFDVQDHLVAGKLIAFGYREGAPLDEGPVQIPAHLFPRGGEDTAAIDWDLSVLRSSGFTFARIRVTKPQRPRKPLTAAPEANKTMAHKFEPTTSLSPTTQMPTSVPAEPSRKMGRPSVEKPLRAVVRSLIDAGELKDKSRKEQVAIIQTAARAAHPDLFLKVTQPSRDKILPRFAPRG